MLAIKRSRMRSALIGGAALLAVLLVLSLTTMRPPSPALADEIDRVLDQDHCVGSVERWPARYYAWRPTPWFRSNDDRIFLWMLTSLWFGSDTSQVEVRLYQGADAEFYPPGRHFLRAGQTDALIDDSNFMFAAGTYDLRTRKLSDWTCGPSVDVSTPGPTGLYTPG